MLVPTRVVQLARRAWHADGSRLAQAVRDLQQELGVTHGFPEEVARVAVAAASAPRLPSVDRTDLPFVTIDPESAMDLDQAVHLERRGEGIVVRYAIADVAAFVRSGDAVDTEAHARGETLYGADAKIPLHPAVLSEDAASLLPGCDRPALLWTVEVDAAGEGTMVGLERAVVRSSAKLSYVEVQQRFDDGTVDPMLALLRKVGELRLRRETERGGVSLPLPAQEIDVDESGSWSLSYRVPLAVEQWNAQISLLTGMAAAALMTRHRVGLLRTLPSADPRDLQRLRRTAKALGVPWPEALAYSDFIRSVDATSASGAAVLVAATRTLRGSAYVAFDGELPEERSHSALAAEYAHVTAPLRRLADRYTGEICLALSAGGAVPGWVRSRLPSLPEEMRSSARRASQYERAMLDLVEAAVLEKHVGTVFEGVVVSRDDRNPRDGRVTIREPAIEGPVSGKVELPLGEEVSVRLVSADVSARKVAFELTTRS